MKSQLLLGLLRISVGWIFLWAFFDKLLGLGFATTPDKSWLSGASPTFGFLHFGTTGTFSPFFKSLAGNLLVDWLFILGLLGIGIAFTLGIARKIATLCATLLLFLMWFALFPPKNNPIIDEHIIYILALQLLFQLHSGEALGLGKWWDKTELVKKYSFLK